MVCILKLTEYRAYGFAWSEYILYKCIVYLIVKAAIFMIKFRLQLRIILCALVNKILTFFNFKLLRSKYPERLIEPSFSVNFNKIIVKIRSEEIDCNLGWKYMSNYSFVRVLQIEIINLQIYNFLFNFSEYGTTLYWISRTSIKYFL